MLRVERAVRQADVVEDVVHLGRRHSLADVLLNQIAELGGLFDSGAALGAQMQDEGAGIAAGKEVLSQERNQQKRAEAEQQEDGNKDHARLHQPSQQTLT